MVGRIISIGLVLAFSSVHAVAGPPDPASQKALKDRKEELTIKIKAAAAECRCMADQVEKYVSLFDKNSAAKATTDLMYKLKQYFSKTFIGVNLNSKSQIYDFVNDMKVNAGRAQTDAGKILREWDDNKNTPKDLQTLGLKISDGLRGMSSYCAAPYGFIKEAILKIKKDAVLDQAACSKPVVSQEKISDPPTTPASKRPPPPTTRPRWVPTKPSEKVILKFPKSGK